MGRADSPLRNRVIFVEGAPRSGTTWLVTLLAMHPQIAGVEAESHLFDFGVDRLFDNRENRDPLLHGLRQYVAREELLDLTRDLCDGIFMAMREKVAPATTPAFVVEKTPVGARTDGVDVELKRDLYPDAWYIHLVRDREAVTRSLMRSPFMGDRSYENCAGLWDRVVGDLRRHLGGLPRYREVPYEELRRDPAEGCRQLFEWLGLPAGDDVLDVVRALSRELFSDMGAVPPRPAGGASEGAAARARRAVGRVRARLGPTGSEPAPAPPESAALFLFIQALHECDPETLRSLTHAKLEFVHRRPEGDVWLEGDEAREALVRFGQEAFGRRYVGEWWGSGGGGPGEWWS